MSESKPTSEIKKIIYASPRFGINLFMGLVDFALLYLYKEVYELSGIFVGISLMLGKFSAGIFQFIIPWSSDHLSSKWGKRKPFIVIMSPILTITFIMLLLPGIFLGANPPELELFSWFAIFNVISQGSYAMTTIYHSWTAEQFPVYERPKVSQYQNLFNYAAMALVTIFSMLVLTGVKDQLKTDPTKIPSDYLFSIIIFAAIMIALVLICVFYMPIEKTPKYSTGFKEEFRKIIKNKNFINMTFIQGFSSLSWAMINAVLLSYVDVVLHLEGMNLYIAAGIIFLALILAVIFWRKQIEVIGKKKTLLIIFLFGICVPPFSLLGIFPFSTNIIFGAIFLSFVAAMMSGWSLFPYIIYPDLAQDAEKREGELKTGLYQGFPSLILNIFQALSLLLTGWLLDLPKISNGVGEPFTLGYVLWGPLCVVFFLFIFWFVKYFVQLDFDWEKDEKAKISK